MQEKENITLDKIKERIDFYKKEKPDFDKYVLDIDEAEREHKKARGIGGVIVIIILPLLLLCSLLDIDAGVVIGLFPVLMVGVAFFLWGNQPMGKEYEEYYISRYFEIHNLPEEEIELASPIFFNRRITKDIPMIQNAIVSGSIAAEEIDVMFSDFGYDTDYDCDADGDD